MPARSPGESAWSGLGGMSLVPARPRHRCSDQIGSETPHARCGSARSEDCTRIGGRSAAGGHRLGRHDPRVVVAQPGSAAPMLFVDRISLAALWRVTSGELVSVCVDVRPLASRSVPEQCEFGSGSATSGPPKRTPKRTGATAPSTLAGTESACYARSKAGPRDPALWWLLCAEGRARRGLTQVDAPGAIGTLGRPGPHCEIH